MELKNPKHELFCKLYIFGGAIWANATRCYMVVYPKANLETAQNNGPKLTRRYRQSRIAELFEARMRGERCFMELSKT